MAVVWVEVGSSLHQRGTERVKVLMSDFVKEQLDVAHSVNLSWWEGV